MRCDLEVTDIYLDGANREQDLIPACRTNGARFLSVETRR